jgi:hypothetical protein
MSMFVCLFCQNPFNAWPNQRKKGKGKYCSRDCSAKAQSKRQKVICSQCGADIFRRPSQIKQSKSGLFYCNKKCHILFENAFKPGKMHPKWKSGIATYRKNALVKHGFKCNSGDKCPLKSIRLPNFMYEVDHIDNNHKNNNPDNWQILCTWCHGVKTYKMGV